MKRTGRGSFWKGHQVQVLKDTVCQAREFALYLVINREPLCDLNPGGDMITPCFEDNVCEEKERRLEAGKGWSQEDQLRGFCPDFSQLIGARRGNQSDGRDWGGRTERGVVENPSRGGTGLWHQ